MKTVLLVLQGEHGQIQRILSAAKTGAEAREHLGRTVAILNASRWKVKGNRTINLGGVRYVLISVWRP